MPSITQENKKSWKACLSARICCPEWPGLEDQPNCRKRWQLGKSVDTVFDESTDGPCEYGGQYADTRFDTKFWYQAMV